MSGDRPAERSGYARCALIVLISACAALAAHAADSPPLPAAATGRMLRQLEAEDDWILRAEALHYLASHRVAGAAAPIREILTDPKSGAWLRGRALVALAEIDGGIDPQELARCVSHAQPELRAAAAELLERFGGDAADAALAALLTDNVPAVRYRALGAHARRQRAAAWAAVDPATQSPDPDVLESAARALAWVGTDAALERLSTLALAEANRERQPQIIRAIGDVPNPNLIPLLLKILATCERDDRLFGLIISALQHRDQGQLIAALDKALETGDATTTRTVAAVITVLVRVPELGNSLRRALADVQDLETIRAGLVALGSKPMQPDQHRELFATYLKHPEVEIRALAIRCFAHCKSANLFDEFRESVADEEPAVVHAALGALLRAPVATAPQGQLVDYLQAPLVGKDEEARSLAYQLLGQAGGEADFRPAMAMLGHLLRGNDSELREAAAKALGEIAPPGGVGEVVGAQGYIAKWRVLGTFLNDDKHSAFEKKLPPEEADEIDFEAKFQTKYVWVIDGQSRQANQEEIEREITWADADLDQTDGKLVMSAQLPPPGTHSVGFAVADFEVEAEREAVISIDGDDAFRVWLNGEKIAEEVAEYKARTPCVAEQAGISVRLRAGNNRLFIKSANIDHHWWVRVRLADQLGKPIDLLTP